MRSGGAGKVIASFIALGSVALFALACQRSSRPLSAGPAAAPSATPSGTEKQTAPVAAPGPIDRRVGASEDPATGYCPNGTSTPELVSALTARKLNARVCGNQQLQRNPGVTGRVRVEILLGSDGSVLSISARQRPGADDECVKCVLDTFGQPYLDTPPKNGCAWFGIWFLIGP
jgi:hypothetical protein